MTKNIYILILIAFLVPSIVACGAGTPTPRPVSPTTIAAATLTPPAAPPTAASTNTVAASPTISVTATVTVVATLARTSAPVTPRPVVSATPRASAAPPKPAPPHGAIAFHLNKDGVDRSYTVNVAETPLVIKPLFDVGPVMDLVKGTNGRWGDWSPDNSKFAYILTSGQNAAQILRIRDLKTNENRDLDSSESGGGLSGPSWSPTGDKIAYIKTTRDERTWTLRYVYYNATSDPGDRIKDLRANIPTEQYRGGLTWGKDGRLALAVNSTGASDIYLIDQNGGGFGNLTNNPADDSTPAWSPDGKEIAFASSRDGNSQIYVMGADGKNLRRLSKNTFKEYSPSWSPDGNWIAFTSTRDGFPNIYIMDKNGGNALRITTGGGDIPAWSR